MIYAIAALFLLQWLGDVLVQWLGLPIPGPLVGMLLMFVGLYGFALWVTRRDPQMLRILLTSSKTQRRYDPGKHARVDLEITSW